MTVNGNDVYTLFYDKIECDEDFFDYFNVSEEEAMTLAAERARSYLREACCYLRRHSDLDFVLNIVSSEDALGRQTDSFEEEITDDEADLLAEIMKVVYYERGVSKLLPKLNTFSSSELKLLHSPANERSTFLALIQQYWKRVNYLIADYDGRDRLTGNHKTLATTLPEESDE